MFTFHFTSAARMVSLLFAGVMLTLSAAAQNAQTFAVADVPFAFRFGDRVLPEGRYQFRMSSGDIVLLSGSAKQTFGMVRVEEGEAPDHKGRLVFRRDDGYELQEISAPQHGLRLFCTQHRPRPGHGRAQLATIAAPVTLSLAELGQ